MGNCQAAEAATVLIHHPAENKVERIYWSVTASDVMRSNPGNYVAVVVTSPTMKNEKGSPLKQLKLLRPEDTLLIGHVYRLVSFEGIHSNYISLNFLFNKNKLFVQNIYIFLLELLINNTPISCRGFERVCDEEVCEAWQVIERRRRT